MTDCYLLKDDITRQYLQGLKELFYHLETIDPKSIENKEIPGLKFMPKQIGYIVNETYIDSFTDGRIARLFSDFPYLRKVIRFNKFPNTRAERNGLNLHRDVCISDDPCHGPCPASLNFGIEGCDENTVTTWYAMHDAPLDKIEKTLDIALSCKTTEGFEAVESTSLKNNCAYLFNTNRWHDVRCKKPNGVRRVLCAIHFVNAGTWQDYVEQLKRKNYIV